MPVEINEMLIKAKIAERESTSGQENMDQAESQSTSTAQQLNKAVQYLSEMIKRKNER